MSIRRGTTPLQVFGTGIDLTGADVIYVTYSQGGKILIEREKDDITVTEDEISFELTQEETLLLKDPDYVEMQIRAKYPDGKAVESNIMFTFVTRALKDGVI